MYFMASFETKYFSFNLLLWWITFIHFKLCHGSLSWDVSNLISIFFCTVGFWNKNKKLNSWSIRVAVFIEWYEQRSLSFPFKFLVQENLQLMAFYNSKDIPFFMAQLGTCQTNLFPVGWPWSFTLSVLVVPNIIIAGVGLLVQLIHLHHGI